MSGCWGVVRGFLYSDPVEKVSSGGTKFVSARLKVRDKDKTVFWSVSAFDEAVQSLMSFKQGDGVKVEGSVKTQVYLDKNNAPQIGHTLMTRLVEPFETKQSGQLATHNSFKSKRPLEMVAANGGPREYPARQHNNDVEPF